MNDDDHEQGDVVPEEPSLEGEAPPPSASDLGLSAACVGLLTGCYARAFQPELAGSWAFYSWLVFPLLAIAALAGALRMDRSRLSRLLLPARGDLTLGALVGFILVLSVWLARTKLLALLGSGQTWLLYVYVQLGDARKFEALAPVVLMALAALAHELVFHGFIQDALSARFGKRLGYVSVVGLTGVVYAPSLFLLSPPHAANNPLFLAIALLGALQSGALVRMTNRLAPGVVARAIFLYFSIAQFRLPGL